MADEYRLDYQGGGFLGITPMEFVVRDAATGERLGEVLGWDRDCAGRNISEGDWSPDTDDD